MGEVYRCVLHDVGAELGVECLVLELIEGETLAEGLRRGPLPRDEALQEQEWLAPGVAWVTEQYRRRS